MEKYTPLSRNVAFCALCPWCRCRCRSCIKGSVMFNGGQKTRPGGANGDAARAPRVAPKSPLILIDHIRSGIVMRLTLFIVLLVQSCGAWNVPTSCLRCSTRLNVRPATRTSAVYNINSCDRAILARSGHRRNLALARRQISVQGEELGAPVRRTGARTRTRATDGDGVDGGNVVVRARLSKPVGLVLAEKEMGKPGLVVDDMVEGGSAEVHMRGVLLVLMQRK